MINPTNMVTQVSAKGVEMFSIWADANQKMLRELVDLSATTAKEGVRLYAELVSSAVEAVKDTQVLLTSRQSELHEAPGDILDFYQKSLLESVDGAQKAWRMLESNVQAVTRSAERMQVSAEQAGRAIQATWSQLAGHATSLYAAAA